MRQCRRAPDNHDGYPDQERHVPWYECQGRELFIDAALRDLDGEPVGVSVYTAASFRFGQPRSFGKRGQVTTRRRPSR